MPEETVSMKELIAAVIEKAPPHKVLSLSKTASGVSRGKNEFNGRIKFGGEKFFHFFRSVLCLARSKL